MVLNERLDCLAGPAKLVHSEVAVCDVPLEHRSVLAAWVAFVIPGT